MYCECGCGQKTNLASRTYKSRGWIKNQPVRFISGHAGRNKPKRNAKYFHITDEGYKLLYKPKHPCARKSGYILEQIYIAIKVLGKPLPKNAIVHHIDGNKLNNKKSNLLICENAAYHSLIHARKISYLASGNPTFKKCRFCKKYDDLKNLSGNYFHKKCRNKTRRKNATL